MGFESGIDRFLQDLEIEIPAGSRILDAGCGTGLLGLHFLNRIPDSSLLSTDLQPNFLRATRAKAAKLRRLRQTPTLWPRREESRRISSTEPIRAPDVHVSGRPRERMRVWV